MNRPSSDRPLDEQIVSDLIAAQFPDLPTEPVTRFAAGWDNELFTVGPWIWRFPRRAGCVAWLTREIEVLAVVAETLGSMIPVFERIGEASDAFPYPFVGYRRIAGVSADQVADRDLGPLAADIGALLSTLHRVDPDRVPPTPDGWERELWGELRTELTAVADLVRPLLSPDVLARAEPYLAGHVAEPRQDGSRRFIHNDMCQEHLIVDPGTGRLVGLIDFTDAMVGEPVVDFAGLIGVGGYRFINRVAERYDLPLEDGFWAKLIWLSRVLTLTWLAEAATNQPADVPQVLSWVARAFAPAAWTWPDLDEASRKPSAPTGSYGVLWGLTGSYGVEAIMRDDSGNWDSFTQRTA